MALLKFKCEDCSNVFEELIIKEDELLPCPECGSKNIIRHYQGKCYFGATGKGGGNCSGGNCANCSGCS